MTELQTIIDSVVKLSPTPQILPRLQRLLRDPNSGIHEIINLLKIDAPMTAQIVRLSNSAYYGMEQPSQSLEEAIGRIGFREVHRIASISVTTQVLGNAVPAYQLSRGELLEASLACAVAMVELKPSIFFTDADTCYTIGLLHSIGKIVINQYFVEHGVEIYDDNAGLDLARERRILKFDHAQAGAALLSKWNFPLETTEAIEYQFEPSSAPTYHRLASLLSLARDSIPAVRSGDTFQKEQLTPDEELLDAVGLTFDEYSYGVGSAQQGYREVATVLTPDAK